MKAILKNSKTLFLATALGISFVSFAQEETTSEKSTKINGFVDGFYKFDAGRRHSNGKTAFTQPHNSFELSSINLQFEHTQGKTKLFADLGAGNRINKMNSNDGALTAALVKELYISTELNEGLTVTGGVFQRHFGVERVNSIENNNYSMSYMFTLSPLFNTGVKFDYENDGFNVMVGASNAADYKSALLARTTRKTILGQLGYTTEGSKITLNYQAAGFNPTGKGAPGGNYFITNLTFTHVIDEQINIALDANYVSITNEIKNSDNFNVLSFAGYLNYTVDDALKLTYRVEYFDDQDNASGLGLRRGNVFSNTVSANYKLGNLTLVPELRADLASEPVFVLGGASRFGGSFLVAAIYNF
jgi:hypothetical protein